MDTGGKVPHYKLKPHPIASFALILVLITGVLIALSFFSMEDGTGTFKNRGVLALVVTALLSICLAIVATSKMWFSHLWKKNSTHARHKKHTKYHPIVKEREFRGQR